MSKKYALSGVDEELELGKDGLVLDGSSSSLLQVKDPQGALANVRVKAGTHSNDAVTKQQLDNATSGDKGTVWIEYSTKPAIEGFAGDETKVMPLGNGTASLLTGYSTIPQNSSWDSVNPDSYIVDRTNNLLIPNQVDKQSHTWSFQIYYLQKGGTTDSDMGIFVQLLEFDGTSDQMLQSKEIVLSDSGRTGYLDVDFHTNANSSTNMGSGKGWKLQIMSKESDGNLRFELLRIRRFCT